MSAQRTRAGNWLSWLIAAVLLAVHGILIVIGAGGLVELAVAQPPWTPYTNPELPGWMLLVQWLLMLAAGAVFIAGYAMRLRALPHLMAGIYAVMAAVCALQTFTMLSNADRFTNMAIEYAEYAVILVYLYVAPPMRARFAAKRADETTSARFA